MKKPYLGYEEFIRVKPKKAKVIDDVEEREFQISLVHSKDLVATITIENRKERFYPAITRIVFSEGMDVKEKIHVMQDFLIWFVECKYNLIFVEPRRWNCWSKFLEPAGFMKLRTQKGCLTRKAKGIDAYFFAL